MPVKRRSGRSVKRSYKKSRSYRKSSRKPRGSRRFLRKRFNKKSGRRMRGGACADVNRQQCRDRFFDSVFKNNPTFINFIRLAPQNSIYYHGFITEDEMNKIENTRAPYSPKFFLWFNKDPTPNDPKGGFNHETLYMITYDSDKTTIESIKNINDETINIKRDKAGMLRPGYGVEAPWTKEFKMIKLVLPFIPEFAKNLNVSHTSGFYDRRPSKGFVDSKTSKKKLLDYYKELKHTTPDTLLCLLRMGRLGLTLDYYNYNHIEVKSKVVAPWNIKELNDTLINETLLKIFDEFEQNIPEEFEWI